jgi:hypothetical protein
MATPSPTKAPTKAPTPLTSQQQLVITPIGAKNFLNCDHDIYCSSSWVSAAANPVLANGGRDDTFTDLPAEVLGSTMWKASSRHVDGSLPSQPGEIFPRDKAFNFKVSRDVTVYFTTSRGNLCCGAASNQDFECPASHATPCSKSQAGPPASSSVPCYYQYSCDNAEFPCKVSALQCVPTGFTFVQNINKVVSGQDSVWRLYRRDYAAGDVVSFSADSRHNWVQMGLFVKATGSADAANVLGETTKQPCIGGKYSPSGFEENPTGDIYSTTCRFCTPGKYATEAQANEDRADCATCPDGKFTTGNGHGWCPEHTPCAEPTPYVSAPGTASSDSQCSSLRL